MTIWTPVNKLDGAPSITYNDASVTYNSALHNFLGQLVTIWTNLTRN